MTSNLTHTWYPHSYNSRQQVFLWIHRGLINQALHVAPQEVILAESGQVNVQTKQSGHHNPSTYGQIFHPDDLKPHE